MTQLAFDVLALGARDGIPATRQAILTILADLGPLTDEDLRSVYDRHARSLGLPILSDPGLRTCRRELVDAALVRDTGKRQTFASGRSAILWDLAEAPSSCRSCGAPIRWATTETGRPLPLDASPDAGGNVVFVAGKARVMPASDATPGLRWRVHFATCPQANAWRTKGRAR